MVMAVPSPQCVGREFVRQYYTLLNQEPLKLHRFYTKNSWFLHGRGENGPNETPIMGQEAIYEKIKDLNFLDCRTKIRQVDSHSTLGSGVVVQVSGELSNNGQPMRKFMQTFVLAPGEDVRKYYVHNDIFRYQDEVFPEETSDETPDGTVDSEGEDETQPIVPVANGVGSYEQQDQAMVQNVAHDSAGGSLYYSDPGHASSENTGIVMQSQVMDQEEEEESHELQEVVIDKQPAEIAQSEPDDKAVESEQPLMDDVLPDTAPSDNAPAGGDAMDDVPQEEPVPESPQPQEEKPRTWAAMVVRPSPSQGSGAPAKAPPKPAVQQAPPPVVQTPPPRPLPQRAPRGGDRSTFGSKEARLAARNAPDSHQVFIGNLPSGVKDADVNEVFSKYGSILEIRLNPKNFGFVIFNSPEPVQQILLNRPIKIGTHEINIEEKKPSGGGRPPVGAGRGGAAGGRGGGRGGGPGGPRGGGAGGGAGFGGNARGGRRSSGGGGRGAAKFTK